MNIISKLPLLLLLSFNYSVFSQQYWAPNKYLNNYICKDAAGLAGHALLPAAADTIPQWDGIVMQHSYVGTIGTSDYLRRTVLTHEIGHYLNLQHIWGGNNVPNYYYIPVAQQSNCAFDDDVADTPNTIGWQTCNLNGSTCGELDNVQNYMDYAYCGLMFTEGQKSRMHACLNSSVANRNNLWQQSNLIATGTDDNAFYLCAAKFIASKQLVCVDEPIVFSDVSYHGVQTREWEFTGANIVYATDSTPTIHYSLPGSYPVKLTVQRNGEIKELTLEHFIHVYPTTSLESFYTEGFENENDLKIIQVSTDSIDVWQVNSQIGYNSNQSFYRNNFESFKGIKSEFFFHPVDLTSLDDAVISFDFAYAQKSSSTNDMLQIYVSTNCGQSWSIRRTLVGNSSLKTVEFPVSTPFFPNSDTD